MADTFSQKSGRSYQQSHISHHQYSPQRNLNGSYHNNDFQSTQQQKYDRILNHSQFNKPFCQLSQQNEGNVKDIYENQIPIKIRSQDREEQLTYLTLKMFVTPGNNVHGQLLKMELTDEENQQTIKILLRY